MSSTRIATTRSAASAARIRRLRETVLAYYQAHGRHDLPWRHTASAYRIMVSEVMLQQTQVPRVIEKYRAFTKAFPTVRALAEAPLADVLRAWSGLGYNRRAKYLHEAAKRVVAEHGGRMPTTAAALEALPGIGPYTARAIAAFAYDAPGTFIETNIRAVFIHHCFPGRDAVADAELLPLIERAGQGLSPRLWYSALMDYGTHLKQTSGNAARRSKHHVRQQRFEGSLRQARGAILRALADGPVREAALLGALGQPPEQLERALAGLAKDGLIAKQGTRWQLA
ncbi:MAG TPA: A/G-specific adenine glycosylase [Candidatus Paceibacterota bacterium]|nr:A/G-specific adenine glycosylase [Candidatus Paceibacterota bacterium]